MRRLGHCGKERTGRSDGSNVKEKRVGETVSSDSTAPLPFQKESYEQLGAAWHRLGNSLLLLTFINGQVATSLSKTKSRVAPHNPQYASAQAPRLVLCLPLPPNTRFSPRYITILRGIPKWRVQQQRRSSDAMRHQRRRTTNEDRTDGRKKKGKWEEAQKTRAPGSSKAATGR